VCILFGGVVTLGYGVVFGPPLAGRDPLVRAVATLGLTLALAGAMDLLWPATGGQARSFTLPTDNGGFGVAGVTVTWTQVIGLAAGAALTLGTGAFLRYTKLGTAMRAMANDREITATLGVPVRRVEAAAWFGSGLACGAAGLILPDLITSLDYSALTFLVISSLAAALIGRLRSLWVTFLGGLTVGLAQSILSPYTSVSNYRSAAPFVLAIVALLYLSRRRVVTISRTAN
jgi:branched-chain amino acid transport system permease protein